MPGLVGMISHTVASLFQLSTSVAWVLLFFQEPPHPSSFKLLFQEPT
jgi:hypothetical protein